MRRVVALQIKNGKPGRDFLFNNALGNQSLLNGKKFEVSKRDRDIDVSLMYNVLRKEFIDHIQHMYEKDNAHLLPFFWRETKSMDNFRNNSFENTMPEVAEPVIDYLKNINYDFGDHPYG